VHDLPWQRYSVQHASAAAQKVKWFFLVSFVVGSSLLFFVFSLHASATASDEIPDSGIFIS